MMRNHSPRSGKKKKRNGKQKKRSGKEKKEEGDVGGNTLVAAEKRGTRKGNKSFERRGKRRSI
jgi:hypothetical protein